MLKDASSGAITVTELLTLGLELYDHLRLPAFLVLSEIGIEIMQQRKIPKRETLGPVELQYCKISTSSA